MSNYRELLAQKKALDEKIEAVFHEERERAIDEIRQKMSDFAIDAKDLAARKRSAGTKTGTVEPKYRDPVSGSTWSGRGRAPRWMNGQPKEAFLMTQ